MSGTPKPLRRIEVLDTTLRDGGKLPFAVLSQEDRLTLARKLEALGVDIIEAGTPAASPEEAECVAAVAQEIGAAHVAALARAVTRDAEAALAALAGATRPYLHLFMPVSPHALAAVVKRSPAEALAEAASCVALARDSGVRVQFTPSESPHADRGFLAELVAACRQAEADVVSLADTNGILQPRGMAELVSWASGLLGPDGPSVGVHCHDDLGLASANTLAAVEAGAAHVEVTLCGLGERAGNAALEEVAFLLEAFGPAIGVEHGIRLDQLWASARLLEGLTGIRGHPNRAVTGPYALSATTHARKALEPRLQELLDPRAIGSPPAGAAERPAAPAAQPRVFELVSFAVQTGSGAPPAGVVSIRRGAVELVQSAHGAGPVDALLRAVDRAVGFSPRLVFFSLHTLAMGTDAPAEVTATIEHRGRRFHGRHASPDAIEASLRAYLAACDAAAAAAARPGAEHYIQGETLWE